MKKKMLAGAGILSLCLAMGMSVAVMADSRRVVTLGADLSEQQQQMVLNYFGVTKDEVEILTINNQDERDHLSAYVPLEQIGTRTYSCAYVSPTTSGGIQVKTANLDWVTCNMIATTLSTSGVVNCDVVAASPIKVSGTGALTGIIMAYEEASGEQLDPEKKEIATQELVVTSNLANTVGQKEATAVVNQAKTQIIADNITNIEQIQNVVNEVADDQQVTIDDEQMSQILDLLDKIAQEDYNYEDMADTLQRVEENVSDLNDKVDSLTASDNEESQQAAENAAQQAESEALASDSILNNTDESALGEGVQEGSTLEPETDPVETEAPSTESESSMWEESTGNFNSDGQPTSETSSSEQSTEVTVPETQAGTETPATEAPAQTEAPASENATEVPASETTVETEAPASESATEVPASETTVETEAPVSETGTETPVSETQAVTEAPVTETTAETEAPGYTEEDLASEEDKTVYKEENWYFNKVLGIQEDDAVKQDPDYAEYDELQVTTLPVAAETAQALKDKINTFILETMVKDTATEELSAEDTAAYGNAEIKAICDYLNTLIVEDSEGLLTDVPVETRQAVVDEAADGLKRAYNLPTETSAETEALTSETAATETTGTEAAQTETVSQTDSVFGEATTETFNAQ